MKQALQVQFMAALEMMKRAIEKCPEELWDDPAEKNRFWHVAYHALFYLHLYMQAGEDKVESWSKGRENYQMMSPTLPWPPHDPVIIDSSYTQADLLEYITFCENQVKKQLAATDLGAAESGFSWIPLDKFGLHIYSLRHFQSHVGELAERLWARANIEIDWIGVVE